MKGPSSKTSGLREWIGSVVFTFYFFISVPIYGLVVLLSAPLPHRIRYGLVNVWVESVLLLLKHVCKLDFQVSGSEHLPQECCVVLMKHSSAWETLAQFRLFPKQTWVLKRELMWTPILGWVLALLKPVAINRDGGRQAVRRVVEQGRARLAEGLWVVIFPEGTRVVADDYRRYGISGAVLAEAAGKRVVPVAHNSGDFWPRRSLRKRAGTIQVCIGPPIETRGRDPRDVTADAQGWIDQAMADIRKRALKAGP